MHMPAGTGVVPTVRAAGLGVVAVGGFLKTRLSSVGGMAARFLITAPARSNAPAAAMARSAAVRADCTWCIAEFVAPANPWSAMTEEPARAE